MISVVVINVCVLSLMYSIKLFCLSISNSLNTSSNKRTGYSPLYSFRFEQKPKIALGLAAKKSSHEKTPYSWAIWVWYIIGIFIIWSIMQQCNNSNRSIKNISNNSYSTSSNYSSDYSSTKKYDYYERKPSYSNSGNCEVTIFNDGSIGATIDGKFQQWKTLPSSKRKECNDALKKEQIRVGRKGNTYESKKSHTEKKVTNKYVYSNC